MQGTLTQLRNDKDLDMDIIFDHCLCVCGMGYIEGTSGYIFRNMNNFQRRTLAMKVMWAPTWITSFHFFLLKANRNTMYDQVTTMIILGWGYWI